MKNLIYSERVNLFDPNIYIQFLVQIAGEISIDDLVLAVKSAFAANEATLSKIVLEHNGTAFYEKMFVSGCNVTVIQKEWKDIIIENEKVPFNIKEGELMRVFVIPSDGEISLLIMAHHLVGDGKSITYFLEDVMQALSGEKLKFKLLRLITENSLPKPSRLFLFLKLYASSFNRQWKRSGRNFTWNDYYTIHKTYWNEHSSEIIFETFSAKEVTKMKLRAKEMGVSINSFIITAFLEANISNNTIGMAVDARLDHNRSMSNQATGISVDYTYSEKISFAENAKIVHQKAHKKLDNPIMKYFILQFISLFTPSLIDSVLLHTYDLYQNKTTQKLAKLMGYKEGKTRDLGITNLTKLDIPNTYGPYRIKSTLFIPPVVSYSKHIIGVSTIEDVMTISYHFMNTQNKTEEQEFFKRAINNVRVISENGVR